jgi:FMN-dependent NADH-azoreductase
MTKTILRIDASPLGDASVSRKITNKVVEALKAAHPDSRVVTRDLAASPLPHLTGAVIGAMYTPPENLTEAQKNLLALSDATVDELIAADYILIGAPMWNFGLPSGLKAWVDHIARKGRTFRYTPEGPVTLLPPGKKVIVASARGGAYTEGPAAVMDFQEAYLKTVLGFVGLADVSFVRVERVGSGAEAVTQGLAEVDREIPKLIAKIA